MLKKKEEKNPISTGGKLKISKCSPETKEEVIYFKGYEKEKNYQYRILYHLKFFLK